jgi:hypothetical protein
VKRLALILLTLLTAACAGPKADPWACHATISESDGRPTILVIGDSISMGYTPFIRDVLTTYDVQHNPCNAYSSHITRERLGYWLDARPTFEAITFNNGLWDVSVWLGITDAEYESNLHYIAQRIKAKTSKPLFVLSTTVPVGAEGRLDADIVTKNAIAVSVMGAEGIPVLDLYSVSLTLSSEHVAPNDVHYTESGYQVLAGAVLGSLNTNYGVH